MKSTLTINRRLFLKACGAATLSAPFFVRNLFTSCATPNNDPEALFQKGMAHYNGWGVPKDEVEAVKWWRKAAEQDHRKAQHSLSLCYYNGQGVPKDDVQAYKWISLAAMQVDEDVYTGFIIMLEDTMTRKQYAEGEQLCREWLEQQRASNGWRRTMIIA